MKTRKPKAHTVTRASARYRMVEQYAKLGRAKKPGVQAATGQLHPLVSRKVKFIKIQKVTKTRRAEKPSLCQTRAGLPLKNEERIG